MKNITLLTIAFCTIVRITLASVDITNFGEFTLSQNNVPTYSAFSEDSGGQDLIDGTNAVMLLGTFSSGSSFVSSNENDLVSLLNDFTLISQTNTVFTTELGGNLFSINGVYTGSALNLDTTSGDLASAAGEVPYIWVLYGISTYSSANDLNSVTGHSVVQSSSWGQIASSGPDAVPGQTIAFENDVLTSEEVIVGGFNATGFNGIVPLVTALAVNPVPEPAEISLFIGLVAIAFSTFRSRARRNRC